ncbi:MAG: hypothetical protein JWO60_1347 [Frankiales bacterium]|nr:hypothetical protein [Frankiales bacterium]
MTPTAVRLAGTAVVACLALSGLAAPAHAAGTGGIEVTPIPGVVDGEQVTAFHVRVPNDGSRTVPFALRNLTRNPRKARLYAASAARQPDGTFTVGAAGSSPHATLADEPVTLRSQEVQRRTLVVKGAVEKLTYAAVVVEVRTGSVVTRAATLVYLRPEQDRHTPFLLGLGAAAVALAAGTGVVVVGRRRRRAEEEALTAQARSLAGNGPAAERGDQPA